MCEFIDLSENDVHINNQNFWMKNFIETLFGLNPEMKKGNIVTKSQVVSTPPKNHKYQ